MADFKWYYPERQNDDPLYEVMVRRIPGISAAVNRQAGIIAAESETRLALHKAKNAADPRPGSSISQERGRVVDSFVHLDDPDGGALQIAYFNGIFSRYAFGGKRGRRRRSRKRKVSKRRGK